MRIVLLALALIAPLGCARVEAPVEQQAGPPRNEIVAAAIAIIAKAQYATLVTLDDRGAPQSRIVEPFAPEDGFTIWIGTTAASRKVGEITRDPRVSLSYFDRATPGYVTFAGTARIVRDSAEKARRWNPSWSAFYKDDNRGDDYTLIRVTPGRLEISSPSQGMQNDPVTWRPVILNLRQEN